MRIPIDTPQKFLKEQRHISFVLTIAVFTRLFWLLTTTDYQSDSFQRAIDLMSKLYHPIWPVGYFYLTKPFYILFGNPEWVLRIFSFLTGVGTVFLVYEFVKTLSGQASTATYSAILVSLLPAHVSLSTQSLSEAPFLFFIFAWLLAYIKERYLWSALSLAMASLIRVEAWPLIPIFLLLLLVKWRRGNASFSLRSISAYSAVSVVPPLLYILINKFVGGTSRILWNLNLESPDLLVQSNPDGTISGALQSAAAIFLRGFLNLPDVRDTVIGDMGFFLTPLQPLHLSWLWYALLMVVFGLAVLGTIHGLRSGWESFGVLILTPLVFAVVLVGALLIRATYPKGMLTVFEHVFIVTLAGIGLSTLTNPRLRLGIAGFIVTGLLVLAITSLYSGPTEPVQAAAAVKQLVGSGTIRSRFFSAVGLRGPEYQIRLFSHLAGPYAPLLERVIPEPAGPKVVLVDGDLRPLDDYRGNLVQAFAGLAFDQYHLPSWEDREDALRRRPEVVVLAKDSLELREKGSSVLLQNALSTQGWSLVFENASYDVWRLGDSGSTSQ